MKVSFDFDETLSREIIQQYAAKLIRNDVEVWICTSRLHPDKAQPNWNNDLFEVATALKIPKERIIFCNYEHKYLHLDNSFVWHLDDDWVELNYINSNLKTVGISPYGNSTWRRKCNKLLNLK